MEAIGEATLLLMYTTCLLLRNDDQHAWDGEWVSRTGYGWLLVFLYVVICPSPMFYSLYLRLTNQGEGPNDEESDEFENPLGDTADGTAATSLANAEQRARKAKQQQRKTKSLAADLAKAKAQAAKAQEELTKLKAAAATSSGSDGIASGVAYSLDTRRASQVTQLKDLVESGMVSEETLEKAKSNFDSHIKGSVVSRPNVHA
jgi:hypothetical protein